MRYMASPGAPPKDAKLRSGGIAFCPARKRTVCVPEEVISPTPRMASRVPGLRASGDRERVAPQMRLVRCVATDDKDTARLAVLSVWGTERRLPRPWYPGSVEMPKPVSSPVVAAADEVGAAVVPVTIQMGCDRIEGSRGAVSTRESV